MKIQLTALTLLFALPALLSTTLLAPIAQAQDKFIVLASTTSVENSG